MKHLMVLIIAIVVPAAAMTDGGCRDDVQKFCKDVGERSVPWSPVFNSTWLS